MILKPRLTTQQSIRENGSEDDNDSDHPDRKKSRHNPETSSSKAQKMVTRSQAIKMETSSSNRTSTRSSEHQSVKNKPILANGLNCKMESGVKELNRHVLVNGLNNNLVMESSERLNKPVLANGLNSNQLKTIARKLCIGLELDQIEYNDYDSTSNSSDEDEVDSTRIRCYECSEFGHYSRNCTKSRKNNGTSRLTELTNQETEFDFYMNIKDDQIPKSSTRQQ